MQYRDLLKVKVSLRTLALDRLAKVDRFASSMRSIRLRTFRRRLSEREFERQEFEMLRRMTALLSAVVVVLLAAIVPNAIFATPAHAAENCLSGPSGAAPDGGYWYSRTNPITRQKCWMIGTGKAKATDSGISLPAWLNFGSSKEVSEKEVAEPAPAAGCLAAPNGQAPEGRHWVYRIDNTTGQRCWHLGDQVSRIRVSRIKASRNSRLQKRGLEERSLQRPGLQRRGLRDSPGLPVPRTGKVRRAGSAGRKPSARDCGRQRTAGR